MKIRMVLIIIIALALLYGCGIREEDNPTTAPLSDAVIHTEEATPPPNALSSGETAATYMEIKHDMETDYSLLDFRVMENGYLTSIPFYPIDKFRKSIWNGNKWDVVVLEELSSFYEERAITYSEVLDYTEEGYFYINEGSILSEVTEKGEVTYRFDFHDITEEGREIEIGNGYAIGNHTVIALILIEGEEEEFCNKLYRINLKTGKMELEYDLVTERNDVSGPFIVKDGKIYLLPFLNITEKNLEPIDWITILDVDSGKVLDTVDTSAIVYMEDMELEPGFIHWDVYEGRLYAASESGIFVWNDGEALWDTVIDAHDNDYLIGNIYVTCFKVGIHGEFYCMGESDDSNGIGSNIFCEYRIQNLTGTTP